MRQRYEFASQLNITTTIPRTNLYYFTLETPGIMGATVKVRRKSPSHR